MLIEWLMANAELVIFIALPGRPCIPVVPNELIGHALPSLAFIVLAFAVVGLLFTWHCPKGLYDSGAYANASEPPAIRLLGNKIDACNAARLNRISRFYNGPRTNPTA